MKVCQNKYMREVSEKIYCAFCKLKRNLYSKKHISATNVALAFLASVVTMFILWQEFNAIVMVIFVMYLMFAEIFVQIRWRLSVVCPHCDFDPVLYTKNAEKACLKVKVKLDHKKETGSYLLSASDPFKNLPKRVISNETPPPATLSERV